MRSQMILAILIVVLLNFAKGLYINSPGEKLDQNTAEPGISDWSMLQRKLGLTNQKVELLRTQKDQQGTIDLLNRFIKENPKYITDPVDKQKPHSFTEIYQSLVKQLQLSRSTLKTSLNFELADKPRKSAKRTRRKIAVKMVSDMPSEQIDDLLKMFNQKYDIDSADNGDSEAKLSDEESEYRDTGLLLSANEPEYMYENLYEDEEDLSTKTKHNSLQDLILQASRNHWQREMEETKLHPQDNEHFI